MLIVFSRFYLVSVEHDVEGLGYKSNFLVLCRFVSPAAVPFPLVFLWCCVRMDSDVITQTEIFASIGYPIFLPTVLRVAPSARRAPLLFTATRVITETLYVPLVRSQVNNSPKILVNNYMYCICNSIYKDQN